jgi:flavodoxin
MKKAVIIYHSRSGTTKKFAEEIGSYLKAKGLDAQVCSTIQYRPEVLENADYLFFGCWTSGLFFIRQKPEQPWIEFAARLPSMHASKIAYFTTYKILAGSMFKNMYKQLEGRFAPPELELKSRSSALSKGDQRAIDQFIG